MFKDRTTLMVTAVAVIALVIMVVVTLLSTGQEPIVAPSTVTAQAGQAVAIALATQAAGDSQTTASGLKYQVITEGTGAKPTASSTVTVDYRGVLTDGTEFDSSYRSGQPATFRVGGVIPGWTEGLQLMSVGSKYIFTIPPELAYGAGGSGPIPPNATLIFEVELLSIQ